MPRKRGGARVLGPYREDRSGGVRWRIVVVDHQGDRRPVITETEAEAREALKGYRVALGLTDPPEKPLTVAQAIERFKTEKMGAKAWSPRTLIRTGADLAEFAGDGGEAPISTVGFPWLRAYLSRIAAKALATQKTRYAAVAEFLKWCVVRGHLRSNPCDRLVKADKPWLGKRARRLMGRGKPQLRNEGEVIRYLAHVRTLPHAHWRIAAALPVLTGLRSGEMRHIRVGDVDFAGRRIWVRPNDDDRTEAFDEAWDTKTASSRRTVELPAMLADDFRGMCEDREPGDLLLVSKWSRRGGEYREEWLRRLVHRVCQEAGVRDICAHGLRDTHSSLLKVLAQESTARIGELLGHADQGQTAREHYLGVPEHTPALRVVEGQEMDGKGGRAGGTK